MLRSPKHSCKNKLLILALKPKKLLASSSKTSISMQRRMECNLRVRQLLSVHTSKLHIVLEQKECLTNTLDKIAALISNKRIIFTFHDLVVGIAEPLASLGVNDFQKLIDPINNHFLITPNILKGKFRNAWQMG